MLFDLPGFKTEVGGDHPETSRSQPWVAGWHQEAKGLGCGVGCGIFMDLLGHSWFSYFFFFGLSMAYLV